MFYSLQHISVLFEQFGDLLLFVDYSPLENALIDFTRGDEKLTVLTDKTVTYLIQVICEARVVSISVDIRVVEQSHGTDLIADHNYRFSKYLTQMSDLIVWIIKVMNAL